jgi:hypothetical protein
MAVLVGSNLHKCFHEAGHIETAYLFGASVEGAFIDTSGNGITQIKHKSDLSTKEPIACGGFAVEQILFESSTLVDLNGNPLSENAFLQQAMENARKDKAPFYLKQVRDESGLYPGSRFQPGPGMTWPAESDAPFISYSIEKIVPQLRSRMLVIEALAHELSRGPMTREEIEQLRYDFLN